MTASSGGDLSFGGSIPERYDRYLGPALFEPYARDIAARIPKSAKRVLEVACGTGIVTRQLRDAMPAGAVLTATDLSEAMVAFARSKLPASRELEFRPADAAALPFADSSYDAVVCQFGIMFVPDKAAAFREARRVLTPGGILLFNVWDAFEHNPVSRVAQETVKTLFAKDPPLFYEIPFGFHDAQAIRGLLDGAGFTDVAMHVVSCRSRSPSARDYAAGLVTGTPMASFIQERGTVPVEQVAEKVAAAFETAFGKGPIDAPMRALIFSGVAGAPA